MDVMEALLDGPRARGAFLLRALLDPPWSLRIEDEAPLTVLAVLRGSAWLSTADGSTRELREGHLAIVRGPDHYTIADLPSTPPQVTVYPGGRCTSTADGRGLWDEWSLGIRTWGHRADASCVLLVGTYEGEGEASRPLLSALPDVVLLGPGELDSPLLGVLAAEMQVEAPGQRVLLDRLLDAVLIATLRTWFAAQAVRGTGLVPRPARSRRRGRRWACCTTTWRIPGRSPSSPPASASPGQPWPAASPAWSVSRPWRTWPAGASPWPPTCSARPTPPSPRWRGTSATRRRSRSARRSSARTA